MKKKRILYDHQIFNMQIYGGISRYFCEIATAINRMNKGVIIKIAAVGTINYYIKSLPKSIRLPLLDRLSVRNSNKINKLLLICKHKKKYDIIHPTYYDPFIIGKFKAKLVVTIHDMIYELFPEYHPEDTITMKNKKTYIYAADCIITVSECTKKDLLSLYPDIPVEKVKVIYHGNSLIKPKSEVRIAKLPTKYILYIGARYQYKNFTNFIHSIEMLLKEDKDLHLVCGGGGAFTDSEILLLQELGIFHKCIQTGYTDEELYYVYNNAECFVFPSAYEGFGIPILEAWEAKCPVILSNSSCFPEIADDAAVYFEYWDVEDMRNKISSVLHNRELKDELIGKGTIRLQQFSWEKAANETLKVYNSLFDKEYNEIKSDR